MEVMTFKHKDLNQLYFNKKRKKEKENKDLFSALMVFMLYDELRENFLLHPF